MRWSLRAPLLLLLAAALGCADGDPVATVDDTIPTDVTTPAAALESHVRALEQRDADAYVALLEQPQAGDPLTGFRFYFRPDDADAVHWLVGDSWDLGTEAAIIRNLMDPQFDGGEIEWVGFAARVTNEQNLGDRVEIWADAEITVLPAPDTGWFSDTRLVFTLVTDSGGFYRIRSIREVQIRALSDPGEGIRFGTWGSIKAHYYKPPPVPTDHADPAAVIEAHARSIGAKNLAAYASLLVPDFEFFPRSSDLVDFPWLPGDSWSLDEELRIMGHMMDPHYNGQELPVRAMEFDHTILDQSNILDPNQNVVGVEVRCGANVTVLVATDNGWFAGTRFTFSLVKDANGFYRIRSIREIQILQPNPSVEEASFGSIKALYR